MSKIILPKTTTPIKTKSPQSNVVDPVLQYPEGANHDKSLYDYGINLADSRPNDFSITIFRVEGKPASKTFEFRDISRIKRVIKHMDSLTNDQMKDYLKGQ